MFLFLMSFCFSTIFNFTSTGLFRIIAEQNDELFIDMHNNAYDCVLLFNNSKGGIGNLIITNENISSNNYSIVDIPAILISGGTAKLCLTLSSIINIWIYNHDHCSKDSVYINLAPYYYEKFKIGRDINNLCIFPAITGTKLTLNWRLSEFTDEIYVYTNQTLNGDKIRNSQESMTKTFPEAFFLRINNIGQKNSGFLSIRYSLSVESYDCNRYAIPYFTEEEYSISSEIMATSVKKCYEKFNNETYSNSFIFVFALLISAFIIVILFSCGCCRLLIIRLNQPKIQEGPKKVDFFRNPDEDKLEMMSDTDNYN